MTSGAEERPRLVTGGYRRLRSQWVNHDEFGKCEVSLEPVTNSQKYVTILHDTYNVKLICVGQTPLGSDPVFNARLRELNQHVKTFIEALSSVFFWRHRTHRAREKAQRNVFKPALFLLVNPVNLNQSAPNSFYP